MIQPQTLLRVIDNSGGKVCRCIRVIRQGPKTKIGDLAIVSLRKVKFKKKAKLKLKQGDIRLALIVHTKRLHKRKDGSSLIFEQNYVLLVTPQGKPLGTRFRKPLTRELRSKKWLKITIIAPALI